MPGNALICGISGQDGAYLAQLLLEKGYNVAGTSRDAEASVFHNLANLGIRDRVSLLSMDIEDFRSVVQTVERTQPQEIYNLAGQSSVGLSFGQPVEAFESIAVGTLNLLESVRFLKKPIRLYNACSSECFGDTGDRAATEDTPFKPQSPYATAKATAFWSVANYRQAYDLWCCSGLLFNHESPLRPERFVTRKIVAAACRIADGSNERLRLGTLSVVRDWGWAPEYVEAMWRMLQGATPRDYVVATGKSVSLEAFLNEAFASLGLDWRHYVDSDPTLERPLDPHIIRADPTRAEQELGWRAQCRMPELARRLVEGERASRQR